MQKNWSKSAWEAALPIYDKITAQPFIAELMDGSLSSERFMNYINQDSIYLGEYGKVLAGIAAQLPTAEQRAHFLKFAGDTVFVEQELHKGFEAQLGNIDAVASPSCMLYTGFLQRHLAMDSIEVAVAAVLPCFTIYKEVGDYILKHQSKGENPYQDWIDTYGGEDFAKAVELAENIADELAAGASEESRAKMTEAYLMASKMEWMFWDSAYRMEAWPV